MKVYNNFNISVKNAIGSKARPIKDFKNELYKKSRLNYKEFMDSIKTESKFDKATSIIATIGVIVTTIFVLLNKQPKSDLQGEITQQNIEQKLNNFDNNEGSLAIPLK